MAKMIYALCLLLIAAGLAYHFAALELFNALIPKDAASRRLAADVPYGPDPRQKLDVYVPTSPSAGQVLPVVVFVHGGSWKEGQKNPYAFVGRALAAQGFVVMVPSYRLHPDHAFPAFVQDAAAALHWAMQNAAQYGGDGARVFAMGHSAGAYNVALAVLDKRYLNALGDDAARLRGVITLAGPFDFLPLDVDATKEVFGRVPDLPSTQPVNYARADAPPFLILHGSSDTTVMPRNAISLDAKLRAAGGQSALKFYEGVSHVAILLALAKPLRRIAPVLEDVSAFIRDKSR